jgi:hypothetical protein
MKLLSGLLALACVPAALAGNNAPLPKDNVAEFVAEKLDVTTLPSSIRPKPLKNKKTFSEYGYVAQQLDDRQSLVETNSDGSQINIRLLEQNDSTIYACVRTTRQAPDSNSVQRVVLFRLKKQHGLLKGRESWKEFSGCPAVGGDSAPDSSAYGG